MKLRTHLMLTLPSAVIGQNYGQTSNFQVSSRLTFKLNKDGVILQKNILTM